MKYRIVEDIANNGYLASYHIEEYVTGFANKKYWQRLDAFRTTDLFFRSAEEAEEYIRRITTKPRVVKEIEIPHCEERRAAE